MNDEQFKVLKTMSEATSRMDLNMFAKKVNLNPDQAIQQIHELAKKGFLHKVGNGYGVTEKGKSALKALAPVTNGMGFHFYNGIDSSTALTALTLEEFYRFIKQVNVDSLEFHLYRGDFENWLKEACKEAELADQIGCIKAVGFTAEELRKELLRLLDSKYDIKDLM